MEAPLCLPYTFTTCFQLTFPSRKCICYLFYKEATVNKSSLPMCLSWYFKLQQHRIACISLKVFDASGCNFLNRRYAKSAWGSLSLPRGWTAPSTFYEALSTDPLLRISWTDCPLAPQLDLMPLVIPKCISPPWLGIMFYSFASPPTETASYT